MSEFNRITPQSSLDFIGRRAGGSSHSRGARPVFQNQRNPHNRFSRFDRSRQTWIGKIGDITGNTVTRGGTDWRQMINIFGDVFVGNRGNTIGNSGQQTRRTQQNQWYPQSNFPRWTEAHQQPNRQDRIHNIFYDWPPEESIQPVFPEPEQEPVNTLPPGLFDNPLIGMIFIIALMAGLGGEGLGFPNLFPQDNDPGPYDDYDDYPEPEYYPEPETEVEPEREVPPEPVEPPEDPPAEEPQPARETPPEPVEPPAEGEAWGDPHFVPFGGIHGTRNPDGSVTAGNYDVMGEAGKTYNILSDLGFQMNATFNEFTGPDTTIMSDVGFMIGDQQVALSRDNGIPVINGQALVKPEAGSLAEGETQVQTQVQTLGDGTQVTWQADGSMSATLTNGHTVAWDGTDQMTVTSKEYTVQVTRVFSEATQNYYLDHKVTIHEGGAFLDGVMPHGLLGQTADGDGKARNGRTGAGAQGQGAIEGIEGMSEDTFYTLYEVAGIFDTTFTHFNRFDTQVGPKEDTDLSDGFRDVFDTQGNLLWSIPLYRPENHAANATTGEVTQPEEAPAATE